MVKQIANWLGTARLRILVGSLIVTGMVSLLLVALAGDASWSLAAQTLLAVVFLLIATLTVGSRMPQETRPRLLFTVLPALGLAGISILVPDSRALILGGAFGWLLAAQFFTREPMQREYKAAIKHMRKQEYKEAIGIVSDLIKQDPQNPNHIEFRARLNRLTGHLGTAIKDYEKVVELSPESPVGYNGLAEVYLQKGELETARQYGLEAYQREPDYWVAPYNLGMIEDRLQQSEAVIEHLTTVLEQGLPDSRHRLLTYLWLARAHYRQGDNHAADFALQNLKRERKGLQEWQKIFADAQSTALRQALEADVQLAEHAISDGVDAKGLFGDR